MGYLLTAGAAVFCAHGGTARPLLTNPRVKISGKPAVQQAPDWIVSDCPLATSARLRPCVSAQWINAATR